MEAAAEPGLRLIHTVDATGLKCPLPVLMAKKALRVYHAIVLVTTDPASIIDVPVFCAEAGFRLVEQSWQGETHRFTIART